MTTPTILLAPIAQGAGLPSIAMGFLRALDQKGFKAKLFMPIAQHPYQAHLTKSAAFSQDDQDDSAVSFAELERFLRQGRQDELLEKIVAGFEAAQQDADIVIIQGILPTSGFTDVAPINQAIAKALDSKVILIAAPGSHDIEDFKDQIILGAHYFGGIGHPRLLGCIINKANAPVNEAGVTSLDFLMRDNLQARMQNQSKHKSLSGHLASDYATQDSQQLCSDSENQVSSGFGNCTLLDKKTLCKQKLFSKKQLPLLGFVPWDIKLVAPRVSDIATFLGANYINQGDAQKHRVKRVTLCARTVPNMINALKPGALVITAGDRMDILLATCMASLSGITISAIILTGGYDLDPQMHEFCKTAMLAGLPVLSVPMDSYTTAVRLRDFNLAIPQDDTDRIEQVKDFVASHIDTDWIEDYIAHQAERLLSPPAFRYQLIAKASSNLKRIVLPEGNELRTIKAAVVATKRGVAQCVLLGNSEEINNIASLNDIDLPGSIEIINPEDVLEDYVNSMMKIREHKGLTDVLARSQLKDPVVLGTMMLHNKDVDGLVSGAVHTTANTIRPALQLIKTAPLAKLVSSVFFMCLPDQVLVFGDCAVNPDPSAEELADIAIQSAHSAKAFGIIPRVAMLSYSTGESGSGADVEKVRQATAIVKSRCPNLLVDGPLQYDAAFNPAVAKSKAPNSPVAGQATVFIFPDLNTGNTTYKAVQRSANVLCIGPMLQGLRMPVNDLSRGATVDDIVFTIAITAVQAQQGEQ